VGKNKVSLSVTISESGILRQRDKFRNAESVVGKNIALTVLSAGTGFPVSARLVEGFPYLSHDVRAIVPMRCFSGRIRLRMCQRRLSFAGQNCRRKGAVPAWWLR
jgi:hypothetical protein